MEDRKDKIFPGKDCVFDFDFYTSFPSLQCCYVTFIPMNPRDFTHYLFFLLVFFRLVLQYVLVVGVGVGVGVGWVGVGSEQQPTKRKTHYCTSS